MPLLGYNKTIAPLLLTGPTKPVIINLVAPSVGVRSGAEDLTKDLRPDTTVDPVNGKKGDLTAAQFAALETQRLTGDVEYHWTTLPEYATAGLTVESVAALATQEVTALFVNPGVAGDDNNPGTSAQPIKNFSTIPDKLPIARGDRTRIILAAGTYLEPAPAAGGNVIWRIGKGIGRKGTPPIIVGPPRRDVLGGTRVIEAGSTQKVINDAGLTAILRSTATASIIAGAPAGQVRLSGITGTYGAADLDGWVRVRGATAGNNVRARIAAVGVGTLDIVNAQGVAGDPNNNMITVHDAMDGALLTIQDGALAGISALVEENTLVDITLQTAFASAPLAGVNYKVTRCAATIVFPPDVILSITSAGERFLGMKDIKFKFQGTGGFRAFGDVQVVTHGCEIQGLVEMFNGAMIVGGQDSGFWSQDGVNNSFAAIDDFRAGTFIHSGGNTRILQGSKLNGLFSLYHTPFTTQRSFAIFLQPHGHRCTFTNSPGSILEMQGTTGGFPSVLDGQLTNNAATGLVTYQGATAGFLGVSNMVMKNSGGHGLMAERGAQLNVTGTLGGFGNGGVGLRVRDKAQVTVPSTGMTITGTGGDLQVGQRTARTWASMPTTNPINNEFDTTGDGARVAVAGATSSALPQEPTGATIASASPVTLATTVHHLTGIGVLSTMNPPGGAQFRGVVYLIADGNFTWDTAGNFGTAGAATAGRTFPFVYDGTKWWPMNLL